MDNLSTSRRQLRRREKVQEVCDSQSDALSSDGAHQSNSRQKQKRRMIRRTEDFQNLDTSTHLTDDDSKATAKKVKKVKKAGYLPEICNISEEYNILQKKTKKRRRRKQTITSIPGEVSSSKPTSSMVLTNETDTSIPSDGHAVEDVQDDTKVNNSKRKNRRRKKVQFNAVADSTQFTDYCESDVKASDVSDSKERSASQISKSASDSDSVVYTFRNRKKSGSIGSSVRDSTVAAKAVSDQSDDSVEYTFKKKQGGKVTETTPNCKQNKPITISSNKQKKSKDKRHSELPNRIDLLNMDNINSQGQLKCILNTVTADPAPLAKRQKRHRVTISHAGDSLQANKSKRSTMKSLTTENKETCETSAPELLKRKSVQFREGLLGSPGSDNLEKRRNTYEINKSITDISVLKSFVVENSECSSDNTVSKVMTITDKEPEDADLQTSMKRKVLNETTEDLLNKRITFELEDNLTKLTRLKSNDENTPENNEKKVKNIRKVSNTPFSKVTRRKKVATVTLIDDVSPPEDIVSGTTDESSKEDCQNTVGTQPTATIRNFENVNSAGELNGSPITKKSSSLSESDQNISSFGVSSTPLPRREGTYTLLKEKSISKSQLSMQKQNLIFHKNQSSATKPPTRVKMPNFSLIHKKAFEKMEDIEQLQQRKAERAKLLLSGAKPVLGSRLQSPRNKNVLKSLNFGSDLSKPSNAFDSPKPLRIGVLQKPLMDSPKNLCRNIQSPKAIVKPTVRETNMKPYVTPTAKLIVQDNNRKHNLPVLLPNGFTRYGFKTTSNTKIVTKEEQIKAVANKNNLVRNDVAGRRNVIKGVRSNRRFELLMKMRNKT